MKMTNVFSHKLTKMNIITIDIARIKIQGKKQFLSRVFEYLV